MKPRAPAAALPDRGELRGVILVVQEDRFRLQDERGRGYLLTLGRRAGISMDGVRRAAALGLPIRVHYKGMPDLGAVATRVSLR